MLSEKHQIIYFPVELSTYYDTTKLHCHWPSNREVTRGREESALLALPDSEKPDEACKKSPGDTKSNFLYFLLQNILVCFIIPCVFTFREPKT